ncbi:MAG TPA: DNA mismatch repair protein MutH, partial [Thermoprotei archaeon]|nr:DNA mismatch repair protein MutH [Thermoprotei archaeon]
NWIRNRIFYLHRVKNYLIPRPDEIREKKWVRHFQPVTKGKKYVGALVIDPKPGIHFNVVVVDFASLYPSILKEYNISYETVNCPHKECMSNLVPETTTWICSRKKGLISEFAGIIRDIRVNVFKRLSKDENIPKAQREFYGVIQRALKVIINALYGVIGADTFQFYYLPAAEAVTLYGRYVIKKAIEKADEMGLEVIYGDTDSLFIKNPDVEKLDNLVTYIKDRYRLQLEIDKIYKYTVLSSRKKNYFGITDNGIVDIKGLMGKKSNTPPYIRDIFYQILDKLRTVEDIGQFKVVKNDIIKIINEAESKLISKDIPLEELVITVTLSKKTDQYTKTTPQHVKAARMLERALGIKLQPGHMIRIIKTKNSEGVAPIELVKSLDQVDSKKYIELLHSTLEQILEVLEIKVNRRRKIATIDENRMSLDKFFKF